MAWNSRQGGDRIVGYWSGVTGLDMAGVEGIGRLWRGWPRRGMAGVVRLDKAGSGWPLYGTEQQVGTGADGPALAW
jgi:hypothetical protein